MEGSTYQAGNGAQNYRHMPQAVNIPAPPPAPVNPSCFGSLEHAAERVRSVANRVERLADLLCGTYPEPANTGGEIKGGPNGLFDGAHEHAGQIDHDTGRIHAAIERIEKRLP